MKMGRPDRGTPRWYWEAAIGLMVVAQGHHREASRRRVKRWGVAWVADEANAALRAADFAAYNADLFERSGGFGLVLSGKVNKPARHYADRARWIAEKAAKEVARARQT